MNRTVSLLCWWGFLLIIFVSCQRSNTPIPPTPESLINGWTSWLDKPVCQPPCWQYITPGLTTIDEAISILESNSDVVITYQGQYGLSWDFKNKTDSGDIRLSEDGVVSSIWLGSVSNTRLFVKIIGASYGFPEYVKPYDCREGVCSTVLIYPDLGMFLSVFMDNHGSSNNPRFEILPETVVDRVYFIELGMENFQKLPDFQEYDLLLKWKGYGDYP